MELYDVQPRMYSSARGKSMFVGLNVAGGSSGHRLKQHPATPSEGDKNRSKPFACTALKCPCRSFYYIVAEGAWILRCRCKHKHIDHDPTSYQCLKPKCLCDAFDR
ncbi:unnamed protein product [Aphanomyces euteiches]